MKYSKDRLVVFDPKYHTYYKGDSRLMSVTSFIGQYKNKFDSDYHSKRVAIKRGIPQQQVLDEWNSKAKISTDMGTHIHKIFENYTLGLPYYDTETYQKEKIAIKFIDELFKSSRLIPVETELIVYNDFLAGQIDNISKDKYGNLYILDFKTNSEISKNNYGKSLLNELCSIPDCAYYHYCLQLSIYRELHGGITDCYIIHIDEHDYWIIKAENLLERLDLSFVGL